MIRIFILLLFVIGYNANSQSLQIFDIDTTDFPTMRAKFSAFDEEGKQMLNLSPSDFELTENGEIRKITNLFCPPQQPPSSISAVLVIDKSSSMSSEILGKLKLDLVKSAARVWINALPESSECAITSFNSGNYLNQDFTNDKTKLLKSIDNLYSGGGTDYNAALLNPMAGGLEVSKKGKFKKVIIFLTDGIPNFEPDINLIIDEAKNQNCVIHSVTLGLPAPKSIKEIVKQTEGEWFENVNTIAEAKRIYLKLLSKSLDFEFCRISWESEVPCVNEDINVSLLINKNGSNSNSTYITSSEKLARLEYNPSFVRFKNPTIGIEVNEKITLTARNNSFFVSNISTSNSNYKITPANFNLKQDDSIDLILTYTPVDSSFTFCTLNIINNICNQEYYVSGGFKGKKPTIPTLKLIHPNGGEVFVTGSDTLISWEGIAPSDTIILDYSIDNGNTWNNISNNAYRLNYTWKNIPKPKSNKCLIKASQFDYNDENTNQLNPKIVWQKTLGDIFMDDTRSVIELLDGSLVIAGYSKFINGVSNKMGAGEDDFWILKLEPKDGSIIWQKVIGGSKNDVALSIKELIDGNLVVTGYSYSNDGDVKENKGYSDVWVVKLNPDDGSILWEKTYGGSSFEHANSILETDDGAIIVAGMTESIDGDVTGHKEFGDIWLIKINPFDGSIIWQKTFGGSKSEIAKSCISLLDGSIVIAGSTSSDDGDITENKGLDDIWIVKINPKDGSIIWQRSYGGSKGESVSSIIELKSGYIVIAGTTNSDDGDIKKLIGNTDFWIIKINQNDGSIVWENTLGGSGNEQSFSIFETNDGSLVSSGYSDSIDGDVVGKIITNRFDCWIVKLNSNNGKILWQKSFGGSNYEIPYSIIQLNDGSFVFTGFTNSDDGDIKGYKRNNDAWVVKISEPTILQSDVSDNVFTIVEPEATAIDVDMGKCLVNNSKDSVVNEFIQNIGSWKFDVDSIYFQGADASAFSLVSGFPEYTIEANNSHFAEFRFTPSRIGVHNAEIVIETQSDTLTQSIIGVGIDRNIAVLENFIDFGQVYLGEFKDTLNVITIKNIGTTPFTITDTKHNYPNDIDFTTLAGGGNFTLQSDQTKTMELRFAPSDVGRTSGMLEFHYDGIGSPAVIQLFGEGIDSSPASLKLETIQLEAFAGQEIEIPILITEQVNLLAKGIKTISTELIFNPTLLLPSDYPVEMIDNTTAKINIDDLQISSETIQTLKTIKCKVGLGNAEECELILGNSVANEGDADITIVNGNFKLLGICYEGGTRLINPNSNISIKTLAPNPTQNKLEIYLSLIEKGRTELSIYNISGEKVNEILNDEVSDIGDKIYNVNISSLPSGNYFVVLITPTYTEKKKFIIQR